MITAEISSYGIAAALDEINRRNFDAAETRLAEKMKPARLAPMNFSQAAGAAASDAVIDGIRQSASGNRH